MHTFFVYICVFRAMDSFLPTLKPSAVPYVIMASFSNNNADLLNVVNNNRKLAAWHDGTLLSDPRILKAFLLIDIRDVEPDHCSSS